MAQNNNNMMAPGPANDIPRDPWDRREVIEDPEGLWENSTQNWDDALKAFCQTHWESEEQKAKMAAFISNLGYEEASQLEMAQFGDMMNEGRGWSMGLPQRDILRVQLGRLQDLSRESAWNTKYRNAVSVLTFFLIK